MIFINIFLAEEKDMEAEPKIPSAFRGKHQRETSPEMEAPAGR